jgi:hypothetical protein
VIVHDKLEKPRQGGAASHVLRNLIAASVIPNIAKSTDDRRVADTSRSRLPGNPVSIDAT